ncbi:Alpha-1,4-N-acetylgalactosamine transferase PglJ [hydrothermal vent metagenome]|uniref:Alpha-1,4-N-acetylgalactosamine transferase PglJ n=1 Tax=hydrothermal vent metagenome TaxID=652676 RepID=A0A3B0WQC3_9ZZZZ
MKKIAIITPFLANGGLEKVAIVGAQELSKDFDVILVVMDTFHVDYPYDGKMIDLKVSLNNRNIFKRLLNIFKSTHKLRKLKKQQCFDLVISHGELANLPNVFSGGKKNILTVHENRFAAVKDTQGKFVNKIIKYIYSVKSVFKIITVSEGIRESFIENLKLDPRKIQTIYNPYDIDEITRLATEDLTDLSSLFSHKVLTITGRLTLQKGQWFLLRIFNQLKKLNPQFKLVILGDGEIKDKLIALSNNLDLKTYSTWSDNKFDGDYDVYFMGFVKNPFKYVAQSKLFIMTSLWEGFGNTIVEAMACGTPVVATACQSGPSEIINPNLGSANKTEQPVYDGYGVLMPIFQRRFIGADIELDKQEKLWVKTIDDLLSNEKQLQYYTAKGLKRARDFQVLPIMKQWKSLINSVLDT